MLFYVNGRFVDDKDAKISVFDLGFTRGYAVFEFLRTYNNKPFCLDDHLKRLLKSAKIIGLKHNYNLTNLKNLVFKTLKKKKFAGEANIRIYLTGGEAKDFITPTKANLIILITPFKNLDKTLYQKGGTLITKIFERIVPEAKTIVYIEGIKFLQEARKKGAIEVLLLDNHKRILECVTSNFFAVMKKKIITSKSDDILSGITRKIVIKLAKKNKIPVVERDIFYDEIKNFDEAFITATNKEILPIVKIDNFKIGEGEVGKFTKTLIFEFKELTK